MALLVQSQTWPIHTVRSLHESAQLVYLWHFDVEDDEGLLDENIKFLAQKVSLPGIELNFEEYSVGGQVLYRTTEEKRGGLVTASFVEIEGGYVDQFFRDWFDKVSPLTSGDVSEFRYRAPRKDGARKAILQVYTREEALAAQFEMRNVVPHKLGEYEFTYERSGALTVPVTLLCDEVRRIP